MRDGMRVSTVWRYPVKSMIGDAVDSVELSDLGVVGDRMWALREVERDIVANCRQTQGIMQFAAVPDDARPGHVVITTPDGRTVHSADSDADTVLSEALGVTVRLESLRPRDDLDYFRRKPADIGDPMAYLRGIFGREGDEPLPDFSKFGTAVAEFETPPGTFYDCFPLLVVSTSALRSMQDALPDSVVDVRRFRPSIVVDTGDEPGHPEFGWAGQQFRVGTAVIDVVNDCPRCASLTKQVAPDVPQDRAILRHVVKDLGQAVGMYCNVVQPGTVRPGDEFIPLP